jgi:hypothetical protein
MLIGDRERQLRWSEVRREGFPGAVLMALSFAAEFVASRAAGERGALQRDMMRRGRGWGASPGVASTGAVT